MSLGYTPCLFVSCPFAFEKYPAVTFRIESSSIQESTSSTVEVSSDNQTLEWRVTIIGTTVEVCMMKFHSALELRF